VTEVAVFTLPAVTAKVADFAPWVIVIDVGTLAADEFELESEIIAPPAGAAAVRLTVPVPDWPLTIVVGLTEILLSAGKGGFTVTTAVLLTLV
jgi:hypothetical protein